MPRTSGLALCILALVGAPFAHAGEGTTNEQAAAPTAEEQIRALEQEWVDAEVDRDAATLRRILDEKFIATLGAGAPFNREAFIEAIVSVTATDISHTLSDSTIVTDGDTAVVAAIDTVRGAVNGASFAHAYRYTATYIRRGGRWVALAEHLVRMPEPE